MTTKSEAGIFKPKIYIVILVHKEPDNVHDALSNIRWFKGVTDEYNALISNGTWSLILRIIDHKIVGNKWVYKVKYNTDSSLAKYKARLVAKGFNRM